MKVQNLFETISPFAGISFINELLGKYGLNKLIDKSLGIRSKSVGYQCS